MRYTFTRRIIAAALVTLVSAGASAQSVEGTIKVNGKVSKMTYVTALPGNEVEAGGPAIAIVFGAKAPADGSVTLESAGEGEIGDYLVATINTETLKHAHDVMQHDGLKQMSKVSYGSGGFLEADGLALDGGTLTGRLHTPEPEDFFDEIIEADLEFSVAAPQ